MFDQLMYYICVPLGALMKLCWQLVGNYGVAILLFTLLSKAVILPVTVWVHRNSIKMVKIQPEVNFLKAQYYGDLDRIAEGQSKLFKREKYSPFASIVSLVIQLFLLSAIIEIIYHPLTYIIGLSPEVIETLGLRFGVDMSASAAEIEMVKAWRATSSVVVDAATDMRVSALDFDFLGFDISEVASVTLGKNILMPIAAGFAAWLFCESQNRMNVLQAEQSKISQWGMMIFSVALSLYLGFFVPVGIALYWIFSNLFSTLQQVLLNLAIPPKKYVDYESLEKSRKALADIEALAPKAGELKKREKVDYKRFFGVVNKHLVIYSERSGFYKYFEGIISELLARSNLTIHYVTNDPDDKIFALAEPRIRPYYIGNKKLITLMMRMDADMVLMTTPDLEKYYIKRSLVRKDIEYVYVPHDPMSMHMGFGEGALDHFDTVFCTGPHVVREVRETEEVYGLPAKNLVEFGYPLADALIVSYQAIEGNLDAKKQILIAPSWQEDNLMDSCLDSLIDGLLCDEYRVIVRPHPEYKKRYADRLAKIVEKYREKVCFELDLADNRSIYRSDLLVTDWSGIAPEFAFATGKPVLFVNTKMKVENPNWQKIPSIPVEISLREKLGIAVNKEELGRVKEIAEKLLSEQAFYKEKIMQARDAHFYNLGASSAAGAKYILGRLREIQIKRKEENK